MSTNENDTKIEAIAAAERTPEQTEALRWLAAWGNAMTSTDSVTMRGVAQYLGGVAMAVVADDDDALRLCDRALTFYAVQRETETSGARDMSRLVDLVAAYRRENKRGAGEPDA